MSYPHKYTKFWKHLYNQLEDLYGYEPFEGFLQNPWENLAKLRNDFEQPGLFLAYLNQRVILSSDGLPELEEILDLNEITLIAEHVMGVQNPIGSAAMVEYKLH